MVKQDFENSSAHVFKAAYRFPELTECFKYENNLSDLNVVKKNIELGYRNYLPQASASENIELIFSPLRNDDIFLNLVQLL